MSRRFKTPARIQDFLNSIPFNFGDTHRSAQSAVRAGKAHCFEGALIAAMYLKAIGHKPLLLDLKAIDPDSDHVVALFKEGGKWGAISKTNHAVLRYREPVYASARELAMSYFHEYFLQDGRKTMRSFSEPFDLTKFGDAWIKSDKNLVWLAEKLDESPHIQILPKKVSLRKADRIEIAAGKIVEYKR